MNNPFDNTFFKFLIGFIFILLVSFSILYFASEYKKHMAAQDSAAKTAPTE